MVVPTSETLKQNPPVTADNGYGALHIPIDQLEDQLDILLGED